MCTSRVLKVKNGGYEDAGYKSEQREAHSTQNTGGE